VAVELGYFAFEIHCVFDSGKTIAGPYMWKFKIFLKWIDFYTFDIQ
jgi:hypothetical protein